MKLKYGGFYGPNYFSYFQDQNTLISNGHPTFENATVLNLATLGLLEPAVDGRALAKGYAQFGHHNTYGLQIFDDKTYESMIEKIEEPKTGCYALIDRCRALAKQGDPERFGNNKTVNAACMAATKLCFFDIQGTYGALSDVSKPSYQWLMLLIALYRDLLLTLRTQTSRCSLSLTSRTSSTSAGSSKSLACLLTLPLGLTRLRRSGSVRWAML